MRESAPTPSLLSVRDLSVTIATRRGAVSALDRVSLDVPPASTLGLVGESGSGKSVLAKSILRIMPNHGYVTTTGKILLDNRDILPLPEKEMRAIRGRRVSMVFQDPMSSLNPVKRIGDQVTEGMRLHLGLGRKAAIASAVELLRSMGIPDAEAQLDRYPNHLSGGMRQRVAIAIALACEPDLLIADEPTTALDVTVQAQILDLLRAEQAKRGMSILLITHDLGVVSRYADQVAIIYAGRVVEHLPDPAMLKSSTMPYTAALVRSQPDMSAPPHSRLETITGMPPRLTDLPPGCRFAARCISATDRCNAEEPLFIAGKVPGHSFACWNPAADRMTIDD